MDENIKREIIMEHYQNPLHRYVVEDDNYIKVNTSNSSCIDNLDLFLKINNNIIEDIAFFGEACAISISSTSIMIENLIGKTVEEAAIIIQNFDNMINEKDYDKNVLNNAIVYNEIYKQNSRKTCAFLPYRGILEALAKYQKQCYNLCCKNEEQEE
ncbi:MAG: SUF system NifU family Fe-S cluster assembly protein [Firmicutes bacterium]|nr:SUF system NifU family Fe-S cluster assembly protein [Bacillota bacterium]